MPSFEEMKRFYNVDNSTSITMRDNLKQMADKSMDLVFKDSTTYRVGTIYDCNLKPIEEIEFRFRKTKTYTLSQDQVEYWVQFRPGVNPELDYNKSTKEEGLYREGRLGYYIDIYDDNTKRINKWIILGKDETEFDRYLVLKCNWEFEWIDKERKYHKVLGCLRDRNNYNSGVYKNALLYGNIRVIKWAKSVKAK